MAGDDVLDDLPVIHQQIEANLDGAISRLQAYLRQSSVSAIGDGMWECAEMTAGFLRDLGADVRLIETDNSGKYPLVYGKLSSSNEQAPHLVLYCLYDVQPADASEWTFPPFAGVRTADQRVVGRGACNTKGPFIAFLEAVRAYEQRGKSLPVHIHFVVEGEEEIGSPHLHVALRRLRDDLHVANMMFLPGVCPAAISAPVDIMLGFKGIVHAEFEVRVRERDVHSRTAPILDNAAWRLVHILSSLMSPAYEILVKDFDAGRTPPTEEMLSLAANLASDFDEDRFLRLYGNPGDFLDGLRGVELTRRYLFSPTLNISGLKSGYTGPGSKAINPAHALAKIDMRLLPGMDHQATFARLRDYVFSVAGGDVNLRQLDGYNASQTSATSPIAVAVQEAVRLLGRRPRIYPLAPGSAPWSLFPESLEHRVDHVWQTCPEAQARAHGPDEFLTVPEFAASAKLHATVLMQLGLKPNMTTESL